MDSVGIRSCIFCPNIYASDEFEEHLYSHYHLCFRCKWCKKDLDDDFDPIFVNYEVSTNTIRF